MRAATRLGRLVTQAITIAWLLYVGVSWTLTWNPADAGAYYDAAVRLREGSDLYVASNADAHEVYRYAPWFAYCWVPLTLLPRDVALHAWSVAMLMASAVAVLPIARFGTPAAVALAALLGSFLAETAMFGNVHPAVVALLTLGAGRRWFPLAVGVAASIKLVPILFVLVWIGRREWRPIAIALVTASLLWSQALLFDLTGYVTDPGTGLLSIYAVSPALWLATALLAGALAVLLAARRSRWAWVGAAGAMFLGPPRIALSYIGFLAPAVIQIVTEKAERK